MTRPLIALLFVVFVGVAAAVDWGAPPNSGDYTISRLVDMQFKADGEASDTITQYGIMPPWRIKNVATHYSSAITNTVTITVRRIVDDSAGTAVTNTYTIGTLNHTNAAEATEFDDISDEFYIIPTDLVTVTRSDTTTVVRVTIAGGN